MARNSPTLDIVDAMVTYLKATAAWTTTTPAAVISGPVPPGWMTFPAIGVIAGDGVENDGHSDLAYWDTTEQFVWDMAEPLELGGLEGQWRRHTEWRQETVRFARKAIDAYWGLGGMVRASEVTSWQPSILESQTQAGAIAHLLTTTIRMEVSYREAVT